MSAPRSIPQILGLTIGENRTIESLRDRHLIDHERWTDRNLAHLRFLRWLVLTGRLLP